MSIPQSVAAKLNEQVASEFHASHIYLAMACQFDTMGLSALSRFFRNQADEERSHALKIVDFLIDTGSKVTLGSIGAARGDYESVVAALQAALAHEEKVTAQIHALVALTEQEKDYPTRSFLQWFVDEQVEEVATSSHLVQLAQLAGPNLLELESAVARMTAK